ERPADARVRRSRRADEADADDALRDERAAGHHDAVRRRGGREGGLRAHRRAAREDRSVRPAPRSRASRKADTLALVRTEVDCWVASDYWDRDIGHFSTGRLDVSLARTS